MTATMDQATGLQQTSGKPFTGKHMLAMMLAFFGVIIAVNITMAFMAGSTWTGLIVKNPYVESQKFNANTQALQAQAAHGWNLSVSYDAKALSVQLKDSAGAPLRDAIVTIGLGRPVHEHDDRTVTLLEQSPGIYSADEALPHGEWALSINVIGAKGETLTRPYRMIVKP